MNAFYNWITSHKRLLVMVVVMVTITTIIYCLSVNNNKNNMLQKKKAVYPADYQTKIEGLRFYGLNDGRKAISIVAESFVIEKKKFGFLTFSILYVARLNNACIDLYALLPSDPSSARKRASASTFSAALSKETFADFPVSLSAMSDLEVGPIIVRFFEGDRLISQIQAADARIMLNDRSIIFSGNVRATAGTSELNTDQLSFLPDRSSLRMESLYRLRRAEVRTFGNSLTTDLQLREIVP